MGWILAILAILCRSMNRNDWRRVRGRMVREHHVIAASAVMKDDKKNRQQQMYDKLLAAYVRRYGNEKSN